MKYGRLCTFLQAHMRFIPGGNGNSPHRWMQNRRRCLHYRTQSWRFWGHWQLLGLHVVRWTEWVRMYGIASGLPFLVFPYFCDIHEGKHMSCVMYGIAVTRPCVRCLGTIDDIRNLWESNKLQASQIMLAREEYVWLVGRPERMDKKTFIERVELGSSCRR